VAGRRRRALPAARTTGEVPELPEVELVRRGLDTTIVGRRVEAIEVRSASSPAVPAARLKRAVQGGRLTAVARRGKVLIVELDSGAHLLVHPMMTGQFVVTGNGRTLFTGGHPSRSMLGPMPNQTTRIVFRLSGGRALYFNDARKFGRIRLLDSGAPLSADQFLARLGPEPLGDEFTLAGFRSQLERHRRAPIKAVLLNQSVLSGVGNIYADESLHLARVHPARLAGWLNGTESRRLHDAIRRIIGLAIDCGGTSFADYADPAREPTGYLARARVFRRQGEPCPVCGTVIERIRVAGRSTNICPRCQPAPGQLR
jgi:formamidopyrimidine-DNA glycosylase